MRHLPGVEIGQVVRRDDPDGFGRIKLTVPGIIEGESANWAEPLGVSGGGFAQRGTFEPPAVGATVAVLFRRGDPDFPYYLTGPWGAPNGVSDIPTNAIVEGEDRQNAATEDAEFLIERDSRAVEQKLTMTHKSSSAAVQIDGAADRVNLGRTTATEAVVPGTTYRTDEAALLTDIQSRLTLAGANLNTAGVDPALVALAPNAATALVSAGANLVQAAVDIGSSSLASAANHLSTNVFTE